MLLSPSSFPCIIVGAHCTRTRAQLLLQPQPVVPSGSAPAHSAVKKPAAFMLDLHDLRLVNWSHRVRVSW